MEMIHVGTPDYYGYLAERRFEAHRRFQASQRRRKAQDSALVWVGLVGAVLGYGMVKSRRIR